MVSELALCKASRQLSFFLLQKKRPLERLPNVKRRCSYLGLSYILLHRHRTYHGELGVALLEEIFDIFFTRMEDNY
jgi:hypothetical protein